MFPLTFNFFKKIIFIICALFTLNAHIVFAFEDSPWMELGMLEEDYITITSKIDAVEMATVSFIYTENPTIQTILPNKLIVKPIEPGIPMSKMDFEIRSILKMNLIDKSIVEIKNILNESIANKSKLEMKKFLPALFVKSSSVEIQKILTAMFVDDNLSLEIPNVFQSLKIDFQEFDIGKVFAGIIVDLEKIEFEKILSKKSIENFSIEIQSNFPQETPDLSNTSAFIVKNINSENKIKSIDIAIQTFLKIIPSDYTKVKIQNILQQFCVNSSNFVIEKLLIEVFANETKIKIQDVLSAVILTKSEIEIKDIFKAIKIQKTSCDLYSLFSSGKLGWITKRIKIEQVKGNEEKVEELKSQFNALLNEWVNELDWDGIPTDNMIDY